MTEKIHDIAIIGGGVNGCGIARDMAGRGASVILFEKGDLAQGTSSCSTKLIHGGLRYLEHYEFGLVRESLSEREKLWRIAPHLIQPMRFVLPWVDGLRPKWMLRAGLFLYDHIGGRTALPPTKTVNLSRHEAGGPLKQGFGTAFIYSDAVVDDARLVILNARDAANRGADIHCRTKVHSLHRDESEWRLLTDGGVYRARVLVNAAGPSVLGLDAQAGVNSDKHMRLVRGSHIVVPRLYDHSFPYFFQLPDGRIFFAIPYHRDFTLIGTTDADHVGSLDGVEASESEIAYLCEGASRYFARAISPEDVVWSYAGVRPLIDDGSSKPEAATRGYQLLLDDGGGREAPILSVHGGKITTYRHLAEEAAAQLQTVLPLRSDRNWTSEVPLPGGDFPMMGLNDLTHHLQSDYPFLSAATADRITKSYGTCAWTWLGAAKTKADLGIDFGHGLSEAEIGYQIDREWARHTTDILWRRSKLGLHLGAEQVSAVTRYLEG